MSEKKKGCGSSKGTPSDIGNQLIKRYSTSEGYTPGYLTKKTGNSRQSQLTELNRPTGSVLLIDHENDSMGDSAAGRSKPAPVAKNKWLTASVAENAAAVVVLHHSKRAAPKYGLNGR